ncbi:hypothetical protein ZEAMMB73_Zm00001d046411 [Zea mays]|uniref:CCHC-type domain-containing protein n=1 Tax=Zea mays TaxID=4577 RepID=A0A1D6P2J6_MAIZE|nr:hypothetical protein ZEAMMB73_Zm00001d046411 [Zea mays]
MAPIASDSPAANSPASPPAATPAPAATFPSQPSPGKSLSSLPPAAAPFYPARTGPSGRSKPLRWADVVEEGEISPPCAPASYRGALLRAPAKNDRGAGTSAAQSRSSSLAAAPRLRSIVVRPREPTRPRSAARRKMRRPSAAAPRGHRRRGRVSPPDHDGWRRVLPQQRCSPPSWPGGSSAAVRSARPPACLEGKCLNCLSFSHRVATCRLPPRCLRCRGFCHLARDCKRPRRASGAGAGLAGAGAPRRFVRARRVGSSTPCGSNAEGSTPPSSPNLPHRVADGSAATGLLPGHHLLRPSVAVCFIDRSDDISGEEDSLATSLLVRAGNGRRDIPIAEARRAFLALPRVRAGDFELRPSHPDNFLLLPASAGVRDLLLGARPVVVHGTTLVLHPWTRLAHATRVELFFKVKLEIVGIPPHVWSRDTASKILALACWIEKVDAASADKTDQSFFGVTAWTNDPSAIPRSVSLLIAENELRVVHSD